MNHYCFHSLEVLKIILLSVSMIPQCGCALSIHAVVQFLLYKALSFKINLHSFCYSLFVAFTFSLFLLVILCRLILTVCPSNTGGPFFQAFYSIFSGYFGIFCEKVEILTA